MTATQLELFKPKPPKAVPTDWGVWVNECVIFATRQGAEWWALFAARFERTPRMTSLALSIAGGTWHVACDTREDAQWLADQMVSEHGIPKTAVKVKRLAQCQGRRPC